MTRIKELENIGINDFSSMRDLCKKMVFDYKQNLKINLIKLPRKDFAAYQTKKIDKILKYAMMAVKIEHFGKFVPDDDVIPICVMAAGDYALNAACLDYGLDLFISYKNISGYNIKTIIHSYIDFLKYIDLYVKFHVFEIDEIFSLLKDDLPKKSMFYQIRYICASKVFYRETKDEIFALREYKKDEFIGFYTALLGVSEIPNRININTINACLHDYKRLCWLFCLINGGFKTHALKFINEKSFGDLMISVDFLVYIRTILCSAQDTELRGHLLDFLAMQVKSKKNMDSRSFILSKTLLCIHTVSMLSVYLTKAFFPQFFKLDLTFLQKRLCRLNDGFYNISGKIYSALHAKSKNIKTVIRDLVCIPDLDIKFDITAIFYIKNSIVLKDDIENSLEDFKKIFYKEHSYPILKALLDANILFLYIKPMENTRHLLLPDQKYSTDEYALNSVYHLENIKDKFIQNIYDDLCVDGRVLIRLVALMHVLSGVSGDGQNSAANIFRAYAGKLKLSLNAINMGVILIKNQNLMSLVANSDDIYNQNVILNFISHITDRQVLKLVYIITYCISNATNSYNSYTQKLLRELYDIASKSFNSSDENLLDEASRRAKKESLIKKQKEFILLDKNMQDLIFSIKSNLLFIKYQPSSIIRIAMFANECKNISLNICDSDNFSVEMVSKRGWNLAMVLERLSDLDLAYMEIFELFDNKVFVKLEYNEAANHEPQTMQTMIISAMCESQNIVMQKPVILGNEIKFDKNHSKTYAKMTINAKDQLGLMAYVLWAFEKFDIKIANARIQTIKGRTRNLFLIQKDLSLDLNLEKILNFIKTD